jgi:hypothetical protein
MTMAKIMTATMAMEAPMIMPIGRARIERKDSLKIKRHSNQENNFNKLIMHASQQKLQSLFH